MHVIFRAFTVLEQFLCLSYEKLCVKLGSTNTSWHIDVHYVKIFCALYGFSPFKLLIILTGLVHVYKRVLVNFQLYIVQYNIYSMDSLSPSQAYLQYVHIWFTVFNLALMYFLYHFVLVRKLSFHFDNEVPKSYAL